MKKATAFDYINKPQGYCKKQIKAHTGYTQEQLRFKTRVELMQIAEVYGMQQVNTETPDVLRSKILAHQIKMAAGEYLTCHVTGLPSKTNYLMFDKNGHNYIVGQQVWDAVKAGAKFDKILSHGLP